MNLIKGLFLFWLISSNCVAQVGTKNQDDKIHGVWENSQFGDLLTLILNHDGSGEFNGEVIRYSTQSNQLLLTVKGSSVSYNFILQENSLTLSGGDLQGQQLTFSRSEEDLKKEDPSKTQPASTNLGRSKTSMSLLGFWSGHDETLEFRPDGNCIYLGHIFQYQVEQGFIILITEKGNITFAFSVKDSRLTLTANGNSVVYMRAAGSGVGMAVAKPGKRTVAMELVGNWCYLNMGSNSQTSRCITLNADGSYVYHAESSRSVNTETLSGGTSSQGDDRGTWYVQDDRLYYNSQTVGLGSYRLEKKNHPKNVNDPMIVLDGEPFVTTTMRSPWR